MNKVQQRLLEECLENEEKLNDWERGFIDSLERLDDNNSLTTGRNTTLIKIHKKVVWDGYR